MSTKREVTGEVGCQFLSTFCFTNAACYAKSTKTAGKEGGGRCSFSFVFLENTFLLVALEAFTSKTEAKREKIVLFLPVTARFL